MLRLVVSRRFQVLFHSPPGVLFAFPSRYWFTIGQQVVFSLGEWSPQIPTGLLGPGGTQVRSTGSSRIFGYGAITRYGGPFQILRLTPIAPEGVQSLLPCVLQLPCHNGFGLGMTEVWAPPLSLATTQGISVISFPPDTEMFHFSGFAARPYVFRPDSLGFTQRGSPIRTSPDQRL